VAYVQCALLYTNSEGERRIRCVLGPVGNCSSTNMGAVGH
jgi:hypothetical protein